MTQWLFVFHSLSFRIVTALSNIRTSVHLLFLRISFKLSAISATLMVIALIGCPTY